MFPLSILLKKVMRFGRLTVIGAGGKSYDYGPGNGAHVTIRFHDRLGPIQLLLNPGLKLGELYMDGRLTVENGDDILDFLDLVLHNMEWSPDSPLHNVGAGPRNLSSWLSQFNWFRRAKANVAHHYDLGDDLYRLFLDEDWQYSCAYFPTGEETLDEAQLAKKRHIAAKLQLEPHHRVLDIGCGWGGMALYLHKASGGAEVLGITLSEEQLKTARRRAEQAGVSDKVKFELIDYRNVRGHFDRIVSVGMFEHVGLPQYPAFFEKCRDLMTDDGVMLLHHIARADGPGGTNPWMRKYIFPGGYSPALSQIAPRIEQAGLWATDIEILRLHYAMTLAHWYARCAQNADRIIAMYDARFYRMWCFYLAASLCTFKHLGHVVLQIQLTRRLGAVPLTRDYMLEAERKLREEERRAAPRQRAG